MLKILLLFYFPQIIFNELQQVKSFKLIPIETHSIDNFPIYFQCNFSILNSNYSILFQRQDNKNLYFSQSNTNSKYFNYESVLTDLNSNAILFDMDKTTLNEFKFEIILSVFKSNELLFKLMRNFNFDRKRSSKYDSNYFYYNAIIFQSNPMIKRSNFKTKRQMNTNRNNNNNRKKVKLVVEACVHIHYDIFLKMKKLLKTDSEDYIRMYLSVYFSHLINTVNKIYKRLNSPIFKLEIEFVKLFMHTSSVTELENDQDTRFIYRLNDYFGNIQRNSTVQCDHIFYYHDVFSPGSGVLGRVYYKIMMFKFFY